MQDFMFGNIKKQEITPEPYTLYNKEQQMEETEPKKGLLKDIEYFRSMYPVRVKGLQLLVEEACDEMDYQGSPMYDEYPDRVTVEQLFRKVSDKAAEAEQEIKPSEVETKETEEVEIYEAAPSLKTVRSETIVTANCIPHMPYGPEYMIQAVTAPKGGYQTWEMAEVPVKETQLAPGWGMGDPELYKTEKLQGMEIVGQSRPWGPPCPGCSPPPWGPPPPPPHPWGPPPHPWGPPPRPWGPPPPPPRPWGPPPSPWGPSNMDDVIRLLLFGEMQKRRCSNGFCR